MTRHLLVVYQSRSGGTQAMTDAVMVYDREGQLVRWNAAAEQLLPFQQTDDTALALAERGAPLLLRDEQGQALPVEQWPVQRILNGEVLTGGQAVDVLVRLAEGRDVLMNFSGAPIRDAEGRIVGAVALGRDVTDSPVVRHGRSPPSGWRGRAPRGSRDEWGRRGRRRCARPAG